MTPAEPDVAARRRPRPLHPGDLVAAVAPAGPPDPERTAAGRALLEAWGLRVRVMPAAFAGHASGFLAADDDRRATDLVEAFVDGDVAGIVCLRGGYGSARLLERLDYDAIARNAKPFVGFSDVTALHVAIGARAGLATLHGPNLAPEAGRLGAAGEASLHAALFGVPDEVLSGQPLQPGAVTAPLAGGNLTVLSSLCGTRHALRAAGRIVLLEDVAEAPYRLDRALTQLRSAGVLDGVAGLAFGGFRDCGPPSGTATAGDVALTHAAELGVPAVTELPLGHGHSQRTVALGRPVRLDGGAGTMSPVDPRGR